MEYKQKFEGEIKSFKHIFSKKGLNMKDYYVVYNKKNKNYVAFDNEESALLYHLDNVSTTKLKFQPNDGQFLDAMTRYYKNKTSNAVNDGSRDTKTSEAIKSVPAENNHTLNKTEDSLDLLQNKISNTESQDTKTSKTTKIEKSKEKLSVIFDSIKLDEGQEEKTIFYVLRFPNSEDFFYETFDSELKALRYYFEHKPSSSIGFIPSNLREEDLFHCGILKFYGETSKHYKIVNHNLSHFINNKNLLKTDSELSKTTEDTIADTIANDDDTSFKDRLCWENPTKVDIQYVCTFDVEYFSTRQNLEHFLEKKVDICDCGFATFKSVQPIFEIFDCEYIQKQFKTIEINLIKHISINSKQEFTKKSVLLFKIDADGYTFYVTMAFINSKYVRYFLDSSLGMLQTSLKFHTDFKDVYDLLKDSLFCSGSDEFSLISLDI